MHHITTTRNTAADGKNRDMAPKMLVTIVDRVKTKRLEEILHEKQVHFQYMVNGSGTATSEILKTFGLSGSEKIVCICLVTPVGVQTLMRSIVERMSLTVPGNGIAFVLPVSGISMALSRAFGETEKLNQYKNIKERIEELMEQETEKNDGERYELIISIINQGFSDILIEAAKSAGARGGTIVHARRTGVDEAVKFFGISVQAEKELVAIVTQHSRKKELMQAITKVCGIRTEAHGIVLSLPIEDCAGISGSDDGSLRNDKT